MFNASALASLAVGLLGELVAPSCCAACDARVGPRVLFCPLCVSSVERVDSRPGRWIAAFEYGGAVATAITRLKYEDRADLGPRLGASMSSAASALEGVVDLVVPVPLHPRRLAERGYNQTLLLAKPVAGHLDVRLSPRALSRVRDTPRQASLDREARLVNVASAFRVREPRVIEGARILLVDDVLTTGATLEACRKALHEVGARDVLGLVLARRA
ncbi:MAG TPA: phosphoribosyltransferase family protein [Labilithrix sp.]|nr:phosphoribosyltransferase family protein [Labilithrix sp.]